MDSEYLRQLKEGEGMIDRQVISTQTSKMVMVVSTRKVEGLDPSTIEKDAGRCENVGGHRLTKNISGCNEFPR